MRLTICHLSDIHFDNKDDAVIKKTQQITDAILQDSKKNDLILFIVSGDIAYSGTNDQYYLATEFFISITDRLKQEKNIYSRFFFVPGNHDCDFSKKDLNEIDKIFKAQFTNKKESLYLAKKNTIEQLCKKQQNFNDFVELFNTEDTEDTFMKPICIYSSKILKQYKFLVQDTNIFINCLNTSWLSDIREMPGSIFIPYSEYTAIEKKDGINITIFHHPTNWMRPDIHNEFSRWINKESDLILVGHEHDGNNEHIESRQTSIDIQYGEVLQDSDNDNNSGFIINYINNRELNTCVYKWREKLYEGTYLRARSLDDLKKKSFFYTKEFEKYLNSFDMQISHPEKKELLLKDLFTYPDVEENEDTNIDYVMEKSIRKIKGENLINYILLNKHVSFVGNSKSGKTAMSKSLCLDLLDLNYYPIRMDCNRVTSIKEQSLASFEVNTISKEYGKDNIVKFKQLPISKKILIIDNFDKLKPDNNKKIFLEYFDNYYDNIIIFSNNTYELEVFGQKLNNTKVGYKICRISELGYKRRNLLIKKWYYLKEGDEVIVEEIIKGKIDEAMQTINTLKGNGYMPCIPAHILIVLQQLEYTAEKSQERSNYGYLYEFLITKSIIEMNQRCKYVHQDIATGLLIEIAHIMLQDHVRILNIQKYRNVVNDYNATFMTDANADMYLDELRKSELLEMNNDEITFRYPYIHYYYTAKYMSNNISEIETLKILEEMSSRLYDDECGDIMIFLCHLSKDRRIIECVLNNAKNLFLKCECFDFIKNKGINLDIDNYLDVNFKPEEDIEARQDEILDRQDSNEERHTKSDNNLLSSVDKDNVDNEFDKQLQDLDNAFKTIEVMGQILKNYPGTIVGSIKKELLNNIHDLGMRSLQFISISLYGQIEEELENGLNKIREKLKVEKTDVDVDKIINELKKVTQKLSDSLDNMFGMLTYSMIRNLASSFANPALNNLISMSELNSNISFQLVVNALNLNEFGEIQVDSIINYYDKLLNEKNYFSAKLLRLMVYEHYYSYGSNDYKARQKIWAKMEFDDKHKAIALLQN